MKIMIGRQDALQMYGSIAFTYIYLSLKTYPSWDRALIRNFHSRYLQVRL